MDCRRSLAFASVLRLTLTLFLQKATILFGEPLDFATQLADLRTSGATAVQIFACCVYSLDFELIIAEADPKVYHGRYSTGIVPIGSTDKCPSFSEMI
jgi:hypothetical protein